MSLTGMGGCSLGFLTEQSGDSAAALPSLIAFHRIWRLQRPCELILPRPLLYYPFPVGWSYIQTDIFLLQATLLVHQSQEKQCLLMSEHPMGAVSTSRAPALLLRVSFPNYLCILSSLSDV